MLNKYAEIYGGLVRDLKESVLGYVEFTSIFSPTSYWLDVTGVTDIQVGYLVKFIPERGTYFEPPQEPATGEPTIADYISSYEDLVQQRLDGFAQTLTYDGIMSACTYANDPNPVFALEGQYCVQARSDTWAKAYELLQAFNPALGVIPTWAEIEAQLPKLAWPKGSRGWDGGA